MVNYKTICADCTELKIIKGIPCCYECFNKPVAELDECPFEITEEGLAEAMELTAEQKATVKKMCNSDTHATSTTTTRKPRENPTKEGIISDIAMYLNNDYDNVIITNKTREITFALDGQEYKLTVSATRKPKGGK